MSTLRPPSTSPSPSPSPSNPTNGTAKPANSRASMGRPANLSPISPRPAGTARPASELLGSAPAFQTPESEAIDQWFENLQTYEATLEEMAAASLDANFKEELSSIEQWFNVLSEAERTAALYSLLQSATQVQIRFFITVLQQMARSDPTSAVLLSPGPTDQSPMQTALDAKLASMGLKSPGLKQSAPLSPVARSFSTNANPSLLSSDAAMVSTTGGDAAATLAQQRAKLKASNTNHRISAPVTMSHSPDGRNIWSPPQLGQVAERVPSPSPPAAAATESASPSPAQATSTVRPKSTDLSGVANSFRGQAAATSEGQELTAPAASGSWASQVNTPLVPIFGDGTNDQAKPTVDGAAKKLQTWSNGKSATSPTQGNGLADGNNHVVLDDARKFRKVSGAKSAYGGSNDRPANMNIYGDDGNLMLPSVAQPGVARSTVGVGSKSPNWRSPNPAPAPAASEQMTFGMGLPNGNMFNAANGGMDMQALLNSGMFGMGMGVNPIQAQLLAAQIAAGQFAYPAMGLGMTAPMRTGARSTRGAASVRTTATSTGGSIREEDITLDNLQDIPNWLRSLRLHKYTGNFEGMTWKQIIMLDDAQLEAKGVAALGARRKMLKVFDLVKAKMASEI